MHNELLYGRGGTVLVIGADSVIIAIHYLTETMEKILSTVDNSTLGKYSKLYA